MSAYNNGSNRFFGWYWWRETNPQWPSLGGHVSACHNNLYINVKFWKRSYGAQLWRGDA